MPNWASSTYRLVGKKDNCEKAKEMLKEICQQDNAGWFGYMNAAICPVLTYARIDTIVNMPNWELPAQDCRAWVQDVDDSVVHIGTEDDPQADRCYIQFFAEEAWDMHPSIVQMFADKFDLNLNGVCEEPGMQEYYKIDPDRVFADYIYVLDVNTPDGCNTFDGTYEDITVTLDELPCWVKFLEEKGLDPDKEPLDLPDVVSQFDDWMAENCEPNDDWYAGCYKFVDDTLTPVMVEISQRAQECLAECGRLEAEAAKTKGDDNIQALHDLSYAVSDSLKNLSESVKAGSATSNEQDH